MTEQDPQRETFERDERTAYEGCPNCGYGTELGLVAFPAEWSYCPSCGVRVTHG